MAHLLEHDVVLDYPLGRCVAAPDRIEHRLVGAFCEASVWPSRAVVAPAVAPPNVSGNCLAIASDSGSIRSNGLVRRHVQHVVRAIYISVRQIVDDRRQVIDVGNKQLRDRAPGQVGVCAGQDGVDIGTVPSRSAFAMDCLLSLATAPAA